MNAETVAEPLLSPQVVVVEDEDRVTAMEEATVALELAEHPPVPVAVTRYVPDARPEMVGFVPPVFHK